MPNLVGLDFETYSAVDLPKHGLARYIASPTFIPLIGSVARPSRSTNRVAYAQTVTFINDIGAGRQQLEDLIGDATIVAHNAAFEKAVLKRMGLIYPSSRFLDSAVIARIAGGGGRLEAAAPQLLGTDKLEAGRNLMRLFSIPPKDAEPNREFDPQVIQDNLVEWAEYIHYCEVDAELSLTLALEYQHVMGPRENEYAAATMDMNEVGWRVDVPLVMQMQRRYLDNQERVLQQFRDQHGADELNLNSLKQLKEWCADRGIKATSFNEKNVAKLLGRLEAKLNSSAKLTHEQRAGYEAVKDLLITKQVMGGSSLKKLQVILDTQHEGRLYDQYLHCGAGQSLRTTGRSVQMQNLKRLAETPDVSVLHDPSIHWDNEKLAENIRQTFTASNPTGKLIVGDFSSVESRGLAWLAYEDWKLGAYRKGQDLYKVLATKIYGVPYDQITKEQRMTGKVGELSCGYGAGPAAVVDFAEGMGVQLNTAEATKLVWDWRDANPRIVDLWDQLNTMLHAVVESGRGHVKWELNDGLYLRFSADTPPSSLAKINPNSVTVCMQIVDSDDHHTVLARYFHGCHRRGRNICYYKPSELKSGDLWTDTFMDPKTKQRRHYELYGGKLAGILTQSFCRELFFEALLKVDAWAYTSDDVKVVGQFHDEIVLDYAWSGAKTLGTTMGEFKMLMSSSDIAPSFPLAAEIKHDYRYTK